MKALENNEERMMKQHRFLRAFKMVPIAIVACSILGFVIMHLWNWLMPVLFGLRTITFWQALGLFLLGKLLFGGFHRHGGGHPRWGRHMRERWEQMNPEERERFRAGLRGHGCRVVPPNKPSAAESIPQQ
jgi:hypothetical protein